MGPRLLEDDYGVKPSDIHWIRGGVGTPDRPEKIKLQLPADVSIEPAPKGKSLDEMLVAGDLDGFIGPRNPPCYDAGNPDIVRLFPDLVAPRPIITNALVFSRSCIYLAFAKP